MGGLTECLRTAQLAEHCDVEVAPHFLPAIFIQLAAVVPHLTWLEDQPTIEPLFVSTPHMDPDGYIAAPADPGHGLVLSATRAPSSASLDEPSLLNLYHEFHGTGPPLLMSAGASGDAGAFESLLPYLIDRFTVIANDRRGYTRSPLDTSSKTASITIEHRATMQRVCWRR